ncbi:MAG: hypothetical protein R6U95_08130 [Bacteroidales bacterium]
MKRIIILLLLAGTVALQSCEKDLFTSYKKQVSTSNSDEKNISIQFDNENYEVILNGSIPESFITGNETIILYYSKLKKQAENLNFEYDKYIIPPNSYDTSFAIPFNTITNELNMNSYDLNDSLYFRLAIKDASSNAYLSNIVTYTDDLERTVPSVTVPCESNLTNQEFDLITNIPNHSLELEDATRLTDSSFKMELRLNDDYSFSHYDNETEEIYVRFKGKPINGEYTTVSSETELTAQKVFIYTRYYNTNTNTYSRENYAKPGYTIYVNNGQTTDYYGNTKNTTTISICELEMTKCFDIVNLQIKGTFTE